MPSGAEMNHPSKATELSGERLCGACWMLCQFPTVADLIQGLITVCFNSLTGKVRTAGPETGYFAGASRQAHCVDRKLTADSESGESARLR